LGDELDGPRGRMYLIKQVLEGGEVTRSTQLHLDRCLTCLNCQTTCPSGVEYGRLIDIGRDLVEQRVPRPPLERATRWVLREGLTSSWFAPALRLGQALRGLLPERLRNKVPPRQSAVKAALPPRTHVSKVLMLQGCVQPAMLPNIDRAAARVLDAAGIEVIYAQGTGCCGAVRTHLSDHAGGLNDMRRNVDAWTARPASARWLAISPSCCRKSALPSGSASGPTIQGRLPFTRRAPCSTGRRSAASWNRSCARSGSTSRWPAMKVICAAAPRVPIPYFSRA
jgi:glycolate oxidase iron-sulfur subunit